MMSDLPRYPCGFERRIGQYLEWCRVKGYAGDTVDHFDKGLRRFADWCEERGIRHPHEVTRPVVERYQRHLFHHISPHTRRPLSLTTQLHHLNYLRVFFKWMCRNNYIDHNPAGELELPRKDQRLPRQFLTVEEVERVMSRPDVTTPLGLRDRAALELIYSTAMRRAEACHLRIDDIKLEHGIVMVRKGKGRKDRVVPAGERACHWVRAWLDHGRPQIAGLPDDHFLFVSARGRPLSEDSLSAAVRRHIETSGIGKEGACHLFRHTCATQMLEGGADVRYIQAMLGHANLNTTELYTRVVITKLKEVHTFTHPGARLKKNDAETEKI